MFSSWQPKSRSWVTSRGRPFTRQTFLPSAWMDRSTSSSPFSSGAIPCSRNQSSSGRFWNTAHTWADLAPVRIRSRLVR